MTAASSWELDPEHEEFRASVRAFVDRHVRPVAEESEAAGRPPAALLKEMGGAGLLGLSIPEEDGGGGGDSLAVCVLSEELARASGGIAVTALVTGYMSTPHIARFGTAGQKARYLPALIAGEKLASIAVTEPGTGSNVAGITTRATPHGGGYRLDGTKMFITNAGLADVFVVAARTAPDGHRGITTFIVEAGTPGLSLTGSRSRSARSRIRTCFSQVSLPHEPALTAKSWAMTATARPPTRPTPVRTPSAGSPPARALASRPSSRQLPGSSRAVSRSATGSLSGQRLEIEAIATAHPQVAEAAVVGVADPTKGTVPVAFLTLLDGADPGTVRQEVNHDVTSQLGGYARLGAVYLTSALPKTRTGKTMRRLLRDVVEHGGPRGDTSAMEDTAGLEAVRQAVAADSPKGA
jgi:hypothetical protein